VTSGIRAYLTGLPGVTESFPFGPQPSVYKVGGRIFALLSDDGRLPEISLKCDPEDAEILRGMDPAIRPGYHLNKEHWNTIGIDGSIPGPILLQLIDDSYRLVVGSLPVKKRPGKDPA
jgi:predicted DNA-binding protein (MmcQ/YjbR family)